MQSSCRQACPLGSPFPCLPRFAYPGPGYRTFGAFCVFRHTSAGRDPPRAGGLIQLPEGVPTVRRLVLLTAVAVMAITAVAYAVTNTVTYTSKVTYKGKPTSTKPVNMAYTGILHVDTDPAGNQPDTAPSTSVYYAKAIRNNAKYFPFCNASEIDGQPSIPAKCAKAKVGTGTASSLAGSPGNPSAQSIRENLTVTAVNGPKGKT